jgi:hypothetical protein
LLLWVHWLLTRFGSRTSLPVNPLFRKSYAPPRFSGVLSQKPGSYFLTQKVTHIQVTFLISIR